MKDEKATSEEENELPELSVTAIMDLYSKVVASGIRLTPTKSGWIQSMVSLVKESCDYCGGEPQKWDSDQVTMVPGGVCDHCGAGKTR